jgi:predicted enzyme related to lactoylglutathione lyase
MITAVHNLVYSDDADATRAFFKDVLGWPSIDAHGGWLIFKSGPSELGVHPSSGDNDGQSWTASQLHEISLVCDDIESTVSELSEKGAKFSRPVREDRFGLTISLVVPGAGEMLLYQPKHPLAYDI